MEKEDLKGFLDHISKEMFLETRSSCIDENRCVICHEQATNFTDELSEREYKISGMCQVCQDETFNEEPEEEEEQKLKHK